MNLPLSDQILQEKGLEFAESFNIKDDDIRCSNGWVYLNLFSLKELESKRQQKIESYFTK